MTALTITFSVLAVAIAAGCMMIARNSLIRARRIIARASAPQLAITIEAWPSRYATPCGRMISGSVDHEHPVTCTRTLGHLGPCAGTLAAFTAAGYTLPAF